MGYIANADIEERLGHAVYVQLTDDEATGLPDEDKVTEARLGAEGELDSYLARCCAVPVDLVAYPELAGIIRSIALDLAEYRLHLRREPLPANVKSRREAAVGWLEAIASGRAQLPAAVELPLNPAQGAAAQAVGRSKRLIEEEMQDF